MKIIVHGGAGGKPDEPEDRRAVLDEAATEGAEAATPIDAVEAAVRVLESSSRFNAGIGGAVQSDGAIRTDAGVMTDDRSAGAVCSMPGVEHAVSAARVVCEETPHVLVSGQRAVELATEYGVPTGIDLWTDRTRERWADAEAPAAASPREQLAWISDRYGRTISGDDEDGTDEEQDHDTVGAVAQQGQRLATATSTGGRWLAFAGRVGDVPQVGSGFYCAPAGGASATGAGEDIARATLSRRAVRHLEAGLDAQAAADRAIEEFAELTGSTAGVIVADRHGEAGSAFNSERMQSVIAESNGSSASG